MDQNKPQVTDTQSASPMPHFADESAVQSSPAPKRKGLWAAIIVAVAVVVLGAGTAAGYSLWYQNPEKVLTDALLNASKAKTITYTGLMTAQMDQGNSFKIELNGKNKNATGEISIKATFTYGGEDIVFEGDGMMAETNDMYVRLHNVDQIVGRFLATQPDSVITEKLEALVAKVNDKWIKVSPEDTKQFDQSAGETQKCMGELAKRIEENADMKSQVTDAYKNNKFIEVAEPLGSKDGSFGYRLDVDEGKLKSFIAAFEQTEMYKQMYQCDEDYAAIKDIELNDEDVRTEVWVSEWSHEITKLRVEQAGQAQSNFLLEFTPQFNQDITVTTPESALTFEELKADVMNLMEEIQREAMQQAMAA